MKSSIADYLEEAAYRYPDRVAYGDDKREVTFRELYESASKIASELIRRGCDHNPVVIYLNKSVTAVENILGIICSGCYYTPIDIKMPLERAQKIIESLEPAVIISDDKHISKISEIAGDIPCIDVDEFACVDMDKQALEKRRSEIIDTDLIYILFTSGSTGMPKGVMLSHRAVMDFMQASVDCFAIDEHEIFGNQGAFFFDLSVLDLYAPVFSGCATYLIPQKLFKFPVKLLEFMVEKKVTFIYWVPSALVVTANLHALDYVHVPSLKKITFCGEVMPCKQLNIWRRHYPDAMFVNMYGPTETCCASTYYVVDREFNDDDSLPIGREFPNTRVLILDEEGKEVLPGEQGELCILGSSLAYGYLHNPEKTAEAFVLRKNSCFGEKIYRTGDIVRLNERNEIMYLSRKDFQIKHMGHRIELGEIETALNSLNEIDQCCCMYDEERNKIVAFLEHEHDEKEISAKLAKLIPDYMVPNRYVFLHSMPHNSNGKIDRAAIKGLLKE